MIRMVLLQVGISLLITLAVALILIFTQRPAASVSGQGLDFTRALDGTGPEPLPITEVGMRDGFALQVRRIPAAIENAPLLILVHGSGWHGQQFDALAPKLSAVADVIAPDLRGHGVAPGRRGDIDYIAQFEDDLADLIAAVARPEQKVVLAGHSSGGGLVVRFAGGGHGSLLDGAVLLAPFLKHNAPTTRENAGGWAQVLTRRIIGLSILNTFQIKLLNSLQIIQFNMPQAVLDGPLGHTATTGYSYRLNTGFAPRGRYLKDIEALPRFLLIAGTADEAFFAKEYEPLMREVTDKGTYFMPEGETHLSVVDAPETHRAIEAFLNDI